MNVFNSCLFNIKICKTFKSYVKNGLHYSYLKNENKAFQYRLYSIYQKIVADWMLITATAGAVDFIEFTNPLPLWKKYALKNLKYVNSVKVGKD